MPGLEGPYVATGADTFTFGANRDVSSVFAHVDTIPTDATLIVDPGMDQYHRVGWYTLFSYDLSAYGLEPRYYLPREYVEQEDQVILYNPIGDTPYAGLHVSIRPGGQVTFWVGYY